MRLAERGAIIRRMRVGSAAALTRSGKLAQYMATTRLLFSTEEDRARSGAGDQAFLAPLGVDVSRLENARDASREALRISPDTQLIVCAIDKRAGTRLTTPLRTARGSSWMPTRGSRWERQVIHALAATLARRR